jgi:hypothetical protein
MTGSKSNPDLPYSRESSALRRLLAAADSETPPLSHVYGDDTIATVVYRTERIRMDDPHRAMLGACVAAIDRLDERDLAPALVRGVCPVDDADAPLVWLLSREWALAYARGRLDQVDVDGPVVVGADGSTALETMNTDPITSHG